MLKIIVNDKKLTFNRTITKTLASFLKSKSFNRTFSQITKSKPVNSHSRLLFKASISYKLIQIDSFILFIFLEGFIYN